MIVGTRSAVLAASLLVAAPAVAAQPEGGHYVWVPAGATVMLVPSAPSEQIDFPVARMIAQQEAMMRHMFADMDSLMATMPVPDPSQMIRSVMDGMPRVAPGTGVVMTSISTGNGTCSQTITYGYPGNGAQPQVKVVSTGDACGAISSSGPIHVTEPTPPAARAMTPHSRLWTIGDPPHLVRTGAPPRT